MILIVSLSKEYHFVNGKIVYIYCKVRTFIRFYCLVAYNIVSVSDLQIDIQNKQHSLQIAYLGWTIFKHNKVIANLIIIPSYHPVEFSMYMHISLL